MRYCARSDAGPAILIVEDDPELRGCSRAGSREEGFAPESVATAARVLERVDGDSPDALIIDIGLPDADGRDLCQALRARGMNAPVLFLTARDALPDRLVRLRRRRRRLPDQAVRVRRARRAPAGPAPARGRDRRVDGRPACGSTRSRTRSPAAASRCR